MASGKGDSTEKLSPSGVDIFEELSEAEELPRAVALRYEAGERAPRVVASGVGELARRILQLAEKHQIPIRKDQTLAEILGALKVGHEIPPETYKAVAEILSFLYRTDEAWRKRKLGL